MIICLCIVSGCFCITIAELNSWNGESRAHKAENISSLAWYKVCQPLCWKVPCRNLCQTHLRCLYTGFLCPTPTHVNQSLWR
jgi:hypothetical protein